MLTKRQVQGLNADILEGQESSDVQEQTMTMNFTVAVPAEYWIREDSD